MEDYTKRAEDFLKNEKQFHLGMLETEKPHPLTKDFTGTLKKDVPEGVRAFLSVDRDIVEKIGTCFPECRICRVGEQYCASGI